MRDGFRRDAATIGRFPPANFIDFLAFKRLLWVKADVPDLDSQTQGLHSRFTLGSDHWGKLGLKGCC